MNNKNTFDQKTYIVFSNQFNVHIFIATHFYIHILFIHFNTCPNLFVASLKSIYPSACRSVFLFFSAIYFLCSFWFGVIIASLEA